MKHKLSIRLALALAGLLSGSAAFAATYTVTNGPNNNSGGADWNTAVGSATASGDIVEIDTSSVATINFAASTPNHATANVDLVIRSTPSGSVAVLDGNNTNVRALTKTGAGTVTLQDLRFSKFAKTGGGHGGAVRLVSGTGHLGNVTNVTFDNNTHTQRGAAIHVGGNVTGTITGSSFDTNVANSGGAINVSGDFTATSSITNSTFKNNEATVINGGAIRVNGVFAGTIGAGTRFEGNKATTDSGGAIYVRNGFAASSSINQAIFTGNQATQHGGAILVGNFGAQDFAGSITNSTFEKNTAGLSSGAIAVSQDFLASIGGGTIFTENTAVTNAGAIGVLRDFTGNISDTTFSKNETTGVGASGGAITVGRDFTGDLTKASFTDNMTAALSGTNSGGAIVVGRDFTGNITDSTFSRNQARNDTATNLSSGGAIAVQRNFGGDIANSVFTNNTAKLHGGAIAVSGNFDSKITGSTFGTNDATSGSGGAIHVSGGLGQAVGVKSSITGSNFGHNKAGVSGGAINVAGAADLDITGGIGFHDNWAALTGAGNGGAINVGGNFGAKTVSAILDVKSTISTDFDKNATSGSNVGHGGAIHVGGTFDGDIVGSNFRDNHAINAASDGGAINVNGAYGNKVLGGGLSILSKIDNTTFARNIAGQHGGAINANATFDGDILNSTFDSNTAERGHGGAIRVGTDFGRKSTATNNESHITGTVFKNNRAGNNASTTSAGGAIYVGRDLDVTLSSSTFEGNLAQSDGGAIFVGQDFGRKGGAFVASSITDTNFQGNSAGDSGGAIYVHENWGLANKAANISHNGTLGFIQNEAKGTAAGTGTGGAISVGEGLAPGLANFYGDIDGVLFDRNTAELSGGALYVNGQFTGDIIDSTFGTNTAKAATAVGGAVFINGAFTGDISNTVFGHNRAGASSGALGVVGNFTGDMTTVTFHANTASNGQGGAVAVGGNFTGDIVDSTFGTNTAIGATSAGGAVFVGGAFTGDISNTVFGHNRAGDEGGAIAVIGAFTGDIADAHFHDNTAGSDAGAITVNGNFTGNVADSIFERNVATTGSVGALEVVGNFTGDISNSRFEDNKATAAGQLAGAVGINGNFAGSVQNSSFIGNEANQRGGALVVVGTAPDIKSSTFINNKALGTGAVSGRGGAISFNDTSTLTDNVFLGNTATTNSNAAADGVGGAIYHLSPTATNGILTLESTAGNRTLFYGNSNRPGNGATVENAIHFANLQATGNDRTVTVDITNGGDLLLLDGVSSQATSGTQANVTVNVNKVAASTGDFYLGGRSKLGHESAWDIAGGSLILTDVDYGARGKFGADLDLTATATSGFKLGAGATLGGNGTIHSSAKVALDGDLDPSTWENTGTLASAIVNGISQADIDAIDVAQTHIVGKLTIDGDADIGAGSTYYVDAYTDGSGADAIVITGEGTIAAGAQLDITLDSSSLTWNGNQSYTILTAQDAAKGLNGDQFAPVSINTGYVFMDAGVSYPNINDVVLDITRNTKALTVGNTYNQTQTGAGWQSLDSSSDVVAGLMYLTSEAEARAAFDNLSGEIYSSTTSALLQSSSHIRDLVANRLFESEHNGRNRGVWGSLYGYSGELQGNSNVAEADTSSFGFAIGGDAPVGQNSNIGVLLGFESSEVEIGEGRNSKSEVDSFTAAAYFGGDYSGFQVRAGVGYSRHDAETSRNISAGSISGVNRGDYKGSTAQGFANVGYPLQVNNALILTPFAELNHQRIEFDGTLERGTIATLRTEDSSASRTAAQVGARFKLSLPSLSSVSLQGGVAWKHSLDKEDGKSARRFENASWQSDAFSVRGNRIVENQAILNLGLNAEVAPNHTIGVDYRGELSSQEVQHGGYLRYSFSF